MPARMLWLHSGKAPSPEQRAKPDSIFQELIVNKVNTDSAFEAIFMNEDSLALYSAIGFPIDKIELFSYRQKNAFERYIQAGGACIFAASAKDSVLNWPWFNKLVATWKSAEGGGRRNVSYDGGKIVFLIPGSADVVDADIKEIVKGALPDYTKCKSLKVPDEQRFRKRQLAGDLDRPLQVVLLPGGDILITEHKGDILYVDSKQHNQVSTALHLDVYTTYTDKERTNDTEMGLLGIHQDPDFINNHWLYIYYSAPGVSVDRLSRFTMKGKIIDRSSEKMILEVPTERYYPMAHTGGGMAFDAAKNLYLSTGDNTNPFFLWDTITGRDHPYNVNGFAPIDDRPLYKHSDDRRAAGNSNDLRGKILRIRITEAGTYKIPDGNLFAKNDPRARPEIYVMGNRNPYRISVDQHTGYLYWGEVGPDSYVDSLTTRGPKGYDEINQARKPGNFGYPYFVGNNYAYRAYDYATGKSGPAFDPHHLINDSRNNTGLRELPDAMPAMIWYAYDQSPDFPILGEGGRSAMAGPVYYTKDYPSATRLPDYYNGKLFIYDWVRSWIMAVTMDERGSLQTIEPFLPSLKCNSPLDMKIGPDGKIYLLEYGSGWGTNADAGLFVIDYSAGNIAPVAKISAKYYNGSVPLPEKFSAAGSYDPDGKITHYKWEVATATSVVTTIPEYSYKFDTPGVYPVKLTVFDDKGDSAVSRQLVIIAGNSAPKISIDVVGNSAYYFPGTKTAYDVTVTDSGEKIMEDNIKVNVQYLESEDQVIMDNSNEQPNTDAGELLMLSLDCKSCHKKQEASIGPAFMEVANRYSKRADAIPYIINKILHGSTGVWGEKVAMPAHSAMGEVTANQLASWILSLNSSGKRWKNSGTIDPATFTLTNKGVISIEASYTDNGSNGLPSLTSREQKRLHNPFFPVTTAKQKEGFTALLKDDNALYVLKDSVAVLQYANVLAAGTSKLEWRHRYETNNRDYDRWIITAVKDSPGGSVMGTVDINNDSPGIMKITSTEWKDTIQSLYFVFKRTHKGKNSLGVNGFQLLP
jgi:cytochrome c